MIRLLTRWLVARLRAEAAFVVLLAVAGVGAWLYVGCREARAERDRLQHRLAEICARAGSDATTRDGGAACQRQVAALADFRARTDQLTARTLADALARHDARARADEARAREVTAAAQAAAQEMEIADARADHQDLVDRRWTAAVNAVAGLRAPPD